MGNFKNLKVTMHLRSDGAILDRFLSLDSILLAQHYRYQRTNGLMEMDKFVETKDDLENISKWVEVKNGSISGSIWYVAEEDFVQLWNIPIRKTTKTKEVYVATGKHITSNSKPTPASGEFKVFDLAFETMIVEKVHFYVRGDESYIKILLDSLKYIGKKASVGYGWVEKVIVDEIDTDKSFMLNETTVSKPLSCAKNMVNSHKVAFYRALPPYHSKEDQEACYMPTTSLVEGIDGTGKGKKWKSLKEMPFVSNTRFIKKALSRKSENNFDNVKGNKKKGIIKFDKEEGQGCCSLCGEDTKKGIVGNLKGYLPVTFNDFPEFSKSNILCENCLWSLPSGIEKEIGYSIIREKDFFYIQGGKMEVFSKKKTENDKLQSQFRADLFKNLHMQKIPYSMNIKTTSNTQHVGFKGKVTISNAMQVINYGDTGTVVVDVELFETALIDLIELMQSTSTNKKKNNGLKKSHILGIDGYKDNISYGTGLNTVEIRTKVSDYHKKYDRSIRRVLQKIRSDFLILPKSEENETQGTLFQESPQ